MKLYYFPLCPFSRKVIFFLNECGLDYELIKENYWMRRPEFLQLNPTGKLPVLVHDNVVVSNSQAICEYVNEVFAKNARICGTTPSTRATIRSMVNWFDHHLYCEVVRYIISEKIENYLMNNGFAPDSRKIRAAKNNLKYHTRYIDYVLENNNWIAGKEFSLADITLASHVSILDYTNDFPWNANNTIKDWYALIKSRPHFRSVLNEKILGITPPAHYINPDF